jgi:hypothetical protein
MLNITFIPKMPSPEPCHVILIFLTWLILVAACVLLEHKHYEAVRILIVLEFVPIVALFLLGARRMLSTFTCTAITSNKTTKVTADKATADKTTNETTSEVTRPAFPIASFEPNLVYYNLLIFVSLAYLASAMEMWQGLGVL